MGCCLYVQYMVWVLLAQCITAPSDGQCNISSRAPGAGVGGNSSTSHDDSSGNEWRWWQKLVVHGGDGGSYQPMPVASWGAQISYLAAAYCRDS